jgi:enoyl-CoA hydratase/carnithine racemase
MSELVNTASVLFREQDTSSGQRIGIATLSAEKSLNALTLDMIRLLDPQLKRWAADPQVACVVLLGAGVKAFCAGGDVLSLHAAIRSHRDSRALNAKVQTFFSEEYRLDYSIHTYAKPILVWGSGIVMGGGLGLFAGASHRIVTETSRIAMPEISIGLFPDVGGSWFLRRMPGRMGLFLALTGAALNGHDALAVGLADHFVRSGDRDPLLEQLTELAWTSGATANRAVLSAALRQFSDQAIQARPASNVLTHGETIQRLTGDDELNEVVQRITDYQGDDVWLKKAAAALTGSSPTSLAVVWELWRRAKHLTLAQVFQLELIVALQCCAHPDFPEGVRALLIDKDNRPRWTPPRLDQLSADWISEHFIAPWSHDSHDRHPLAALSA